MTINIGWKRFYLNIFLFINLNLLLHIHGMEREGQIAAQQGRNEQQQKKDIIKTASDNVAVLPPPLRWEQLANMDYGGIRQTLNQIAMESAHGTVEKNPEQMAKKVVNTVALGREDESKDGSSSVRFQNEIIIHRNEDAKKSGDFQAIKSEHEKFESQRLGKAYHQHRAEKRHQIPVNAPSMATYKDKLKEKDVVTKTMKTVVSSGTTKETDETEKQRKGKEQMTKQRTGLVMPEEKGRESKAKEGNSPGKSGVSPPARHRKLLQGKMRDKKGQRGHPSQQGSPTYQTPPDGAVLMRSADKGEVVRTGANIQNPFEALWSAEKDRRKEGEFKPAPHAVITPTSPSYSMPISASSYIASDMKDNANMTHKQTKEDKEFLERFHSRIDAIVELIHSLEMDLVACMEITDDKMKKEKVSKLLEDYQKTLDELEIFAAIYRDNNLKPAYIGKMFEWMSQNHKAPVTIDMTLIMEESLAYLDENSKNGTTDLLKFDTTFNEIVCLNIHFVAYENSVTEEAKEEAKADMFEYYTDNVEGKIRYMLHYLFVGLYTEGVPNWNMEISNWNIIRWSFKRLADALPNRQEEFRKASETLEKYMAIMQEFNGSIASIVKSVKKLEDDKAECMEIPENRMKKEKDRKISYLLDEYFKILKKLEKFSETLYRFAAKKKNLNINYIYIGDLFNWMNRGHLMQIMQESLAYFDGKMKKLEEDIFDFDQFFDNVKTLDDQILSYQEATNSLGPESTGAEQAKAVMIKEYTENVETELANMFYLIHVGMYSDDNVDVNLSGEDISVGISRLSLALTSRIDKFLQAKLTVVNYLTTMEGIERADQKKMTDIEYVVQKIAALEKAREKCAKIYVSDEEKMKLKKRLQIHYQMVMNSLTIFVVENGQNREKNASDFFEDIIEWMVELYGGEQENVKAHDLIKTMRSSLTMLQENEHEGDITNIGVLLQKINDLKTEADSLAKSADERGYTIQETRDQLEKVTDLYDNGIMPQTLELLGYVIIGMNENIAQGGVMIGKFNANRVNAMKSLLVPKYEKAIDEAVRKVEEIKIFLNKARVQNVRENLAEFVANILEHPFKPKDQERSFEQFANEIEYSKIYTESLAAIDSLLEMVKHISEEKKKSTSPTNNSKAGSSRKSKKKEKAENSRIEICTDFGPVHNSNGVELLLADVKKLIRYVDILVQIENAWSKPERELVYKKADYQQTWTVMFQDEILSTLGQPKFTPNQEKQNVDLSTIIKFYSDEISNFAIKQSKSNRMKGNKILVTLELLNQTQVKMDMWHRFKHYRKWLNLEMELDEKLVCNCPMFGGGC